MQCNFCYLSFRLKKIKINKSVDDDHSRRKSIIPAQMTETEKKLYVNGIIKKDFMSENENICFVPFFKIVRVIPFEPVKECYNILNYTKSLKG